MIEISLLNLYLTSQVWLFETITQTTFSRADSLIMDQQKSPPQCDLEVACKILLLFDFTFYKIRKLMTAVL